ERLVARRRGVDLDLAVGADELDDRLPLEVVVLDHEQPAGAARDEVGDPRERLVQALAGGRLLEERDGPGAERVLPPAAAREDVHRDVAGLRRAAPPVDARAA